MHDVVFDDCIVSEMNPDAVSIRGVPADVVDDVIVDFHVRRVPCINAHLSRLVMHEIVISLVTREVKRRGISIEPYPSGGNGEELIAVGLIVSNEVASSHLEKVNVETICCYLAVRVN